MRVIAILLCALVCRLSGAQLTEPNCTVRDFCMGQQSGELHVGGSLDGALEDLRSRYCGCKYIDGGVDIFIPENSRSLTQNDLNFLYHLEEIKDVIRFNKFPSGSEILLPNLIRIRGVTTTPEGFSLSLVDSDVTQFVLPKLREISNGVVEVNNSTWCGYNTVNWEDIVESQSPKLVITPENFTLHLQQECTDNRSTLCNGCDSEYCWNRDHCQTLSKTVCPGECGGTRCYHNGQQFFCCDDACSAGCYGTLNDHCLACKQFNNNGTCLDACPPENIYNSALQRLEENPDHRVAAGFLCLRECPTGLFNKDGNCVPNCGEGYFLTNNHCEECIGECPFGTECRGWEGNQSVGQVDGDEILEEFYNKECVIVNGHIRFNLLTQRAIESGMLTEDRLHRFEHVKVIRGVLSISQMKNSEISYFKNVELIGSRNQSLITSGSNGNALIVAGNTELVQLDLSRLRAVIFGDVTLVGNAELCYIGDFQTFEYGNQDIVESQYLPDQELWEQRLENPPNSAAFGMTVPYRNTSTCDMAGFTCHSECVEEKRCWGPGDTNCVDCDSYRYPPEWRCVPNCDPYFDYYPNDTLKICADCDEQCLGCFGDGPYRCKECRNVGIKISETVTLCVAECPIEYYHRNGTKDCELCNELCIDGCTGPTNRVEVGGCNSCEVVAFHANDTQISCVESCIDGFYQHQLDEDIDLVPADNRACHPCHDLCQSCYGPNNTECFSCKYAALGDEDTGLVCLSECPHDYFISEETKVCSPCNEECDGCRGFGNGQCIECKNFKRFLNPNDQVGDFECVNPCGQSEYVEEGNICVPCDPACLTCVGPSNENCTRCISNAIRTDLNKTFTLMTADGNETVVALIKCVPTDTLQGSPVEAVEIPWWAYMILGAGIPIVILVLLILGVYYLMRHRRRKGRDVQYRDGEMPTVENPMYGTLDDLIIETEMLPQPKVAANLTKITIISADSLQLEDVLGSGAFGTVYKGYWQPDGEEFQYTVAVKVLKEATNPEASAELLDEGVVMASMDHPNIVRLYALSMGEQMMLVSQFVPLGSLLSFLRKHKERMNALNMLTFAHQIAEGMNYLEEQRMVHRDLAARNVLVQSKSVVKITDFGLSKCLDVGESGYQAGAGKVPLRWLAPECVKERAYSHKSDVWAFGVTVWEILTFGARPYGNMEPVKLIKYVMSGRRLDQPATCSIDLYKVLLKCWMLDANSRPDFSALSIDFNKFCMDPLRYISTLVDGQVEDYSELPVNDASIVDKHVYETPLNYTVDASDGSELPLAYTEPGDYDNPDNVPVSPMEQSQPGEYDNTTFAEASSEYLLPKASVKENSPNNGYELPVTNDASEGHYSEYNYISEENVAETHNEYSDIPDKDIEGTDTIYKNEVAANEYTYIADQDIEGNDNIYNNEVAANEYSYIADAEPTGDNEYTYIADQEMGGETMEISRMEDYEDYPEWKKVGFNPGMGMVPNGSNTKL